MKPWLFVVTEYPDVGTWHCRVSTRNFFPAHII